MKRASKRQRKSTVVAVVVVTTLAVMVTISTPTTVTATHGSIFDFLCSCKISRKFLKSTNVLTEKFALHVFVYLWIGCANVWRCAYYAILFNRTIPFGSGSGGGGDGGAEAESRLSAGV